MTKRNKKRKKRKPLRKLIALLIILALLVTGYARHIEPHLISKEKQSFYTDYIDDSSGIRIALFADTHFSEHYTPEDFAKAVKKINQSDPDVIFFLGDLVDDYENYTGDIDEVIAQLASLEANIGKYAIYGNHDYGGQMQFEYPDIMEAGGFDLLVNEYVPLGDRNIGILGIDDIIIGYGNPDYAAQLRGDMFNIVLCHEPDLVDEMTQYNMDMMFAGHTHGRQINIKCFDDDILPAYGKNYIKGLYTFDTHRGTQLYVTSGLGTTKLPMRLASPPEIDIIDLK
ncbi:MAG: metallophosphoesterase [Firmicutes bacterium]|nr:metallophosphoesterase [Bacillota bacterium]